MKTNKYNTESTKTQDIAEPITTFFAGSLKHRFQENMKPPEQKLYPNGETSPMDTSEEHKKRARETSHSSCPSGRAQETPVNMNEDSNKSEEHGELNRSEHTAEEEDDKGEYRQATSSLAVAANNNQEEGKNTVVTEKERKRVTINTEQKVERGDKHSEGTERELSKQVTTTLVTTKGEKWRVDFPVPYHMKGKQWLIGVAICNLLQLFFTTTRISAYKTKIQRRV